MDVGDPLTEAVCWNAAWRMVTAGRGGPLAAADLAGRDPAARRVGVLPVPGIEVLLERAVTAPTCTPRSERGAMRVVIAAAAGWPGGRAAGSPRQRALAAGFAASRIQSDAAGGHACGWPALAARRPGVDGDLRSRLLLTLAARGLASDADLDTLVAWTR